MNNKEIDLIEQWRKTQQQLKVLIIKKNNILSRQAEIKNMLINVEQSINDNKDRADKIVNELKSLLMEDK